MFERRIFDRIANGSDTFRIAHNAHRDTNTTVARHLLHRERLSEALVFVGEHSRSTIVGGDNLWEVSLRDQYGVDFHFVASTLEPCLEAAEAALGATAAVLAA